VSSLKTQFAAFVEMGRSVGWRLAAERARNFVRARRHELQQRARFRRMSLRGEIPRTILGSRMLLDAGAPGLDRDLLMDGIREPVATGHILSILKSDDVVLEVGANIGYYALIEARICRKIYAVEPHPRNFERLRANIALNGFDNVEAIRAAFGSVSGDVRMRCSDRSNWHSCKDVGDEEDDVLIVPALSVDDFVSRHEQPTFMKMDVEGYELEVLRGAPHALKSLRHLFLELHGDILTGEEVAEVLDLVKAAGLKPSLIVQYDRPGMSKIYDKSHLEVIRRGDRGTFELFFGRD
jgi:FkbM family methyltransferase